jgi:putative FmdB family regulatory protein
MPTYEYICRACGQIMEVKASFKEKERGLKVSCASCESPDMEQVLGGFQLMGVSGGQGSGNCGSCHTKGNCGSCGCH